MGIGRRVKRRDAAASIRVTGQTRRIDRLCLGFVSTGQVIR